MTPKRQKTIGIAVIVLALVMAGLQVAEHNSIYSLLAVFFGAVGGQQIGQTHARGKR